jgi:RimJ/RimL family protein N-acetyltransferase
VVPEFETERLRLRAFGEADLDRWAEIMADTRTVRYIGGEPLSREEAWHRLLRAAGLWPVIGYGYWAAERKQDGALIGMIGFADLKRTMTPSIEGLPEAGWIFAPDAHGQGYASEALAACLAWVEKALAGREIVAIIDPGNAPSLRVAEKAGFAVCETTRYRGDPILLLRRPGPPVR